MSDNVPIRRARSVDDDAHPTHGLSYLNLCVLYYVICMCTRSICSYGFSRPEEYGGIVQIHDARLRLNADVVYTMYDKLCSRMKEEKKQKEKILRDFVREFLYVYGAQHVIF